MGQNQSTEDPAAMTVSPGGTPHIVAPRSHPNTSSLNPSPSGPSVQPPAPLLQTPNAASRASPASSASPSSASSPHHPPAQSAVLPPAPVAAAPYFPPQPALAHQQSSPLSDMVVPPPQSSPLGPSSLSQQVRDLIDADPAAALTAAAYTSLQSAVATKVETIPSVFKWIHGGREVFVTGSFNNWEGKFPMQRIDDAEFSLIIDLPPGTHLYKYVVDQEWKLDEDAPTVVLDGGDKNNVIEVKRPVFEYPPANYADSDDDDADERKQRAAYAQGTPQVDDYVKDPIKLPPQLTTVILQHELEGQLLPVPEHVVLNHLYVLPSLDRELLITGITQRFKPNSHTRITHKFVTTVYYAPKPSGEGDGTEATMMPYSAYPAADAGLGNGSHMMNGAMSG